MMNLRPEPQGLYDGTYEHDACGIGFIANIQGQQSHEIIQRGLQLLERMAHRGAEGADQETGDAKRGASLVVWAIQEGKETAKNIHRYLDTTGSSAHII